MIRHIAVAKLRPEITDAEIEQIVDDLRRLPAQIEMPLGDVVYKEQTIYGIRANPNIDDQVLQFIVSGALDVKPIISHRFPLREFDKALDTFVNRKEGAIKVIVEP